jgi:CRISPR-associated protein Csx14
LNLATDKASTLISTMGGQAQVVTFALDALLAQGELIREVIVLHLSPEDSRVYKALAQLAVEFADERYAGQPCRFRPIPIRMGQKRLLDIRDEAAADATWTAIHALLSSLKVQQQRLHLCIAGGRRLMGLLAMSAAMLHFDHQDRLWHMYTPREFLEKARDGAIMHARPEDGVRLIQVPLVPWGAYFPVLRNLATPSQALMVQTRWLESVERATCEKVVAKLTERQLDVLRAFAAGLTSQEVAEALSITVKTVDAHKTAILAECRTAWNVPQDVWLSYHFLHDKFSQYFEEALW